MKVVTVLYSLVFLASASMIFSCSGSEKKTSATETDDVLAQHIADSLAKCKADSIEREKNSTGKVSELALLMRKMEEDLSNHKASLKSGLYQSMSFNHEGLHTAQSTKQNLRNDDYTAYANSYLIGAEALKTAAGDSIASKHNQLVVKCIDCHKSFCTGPISRIKKLRINPEKVSL